MKAQPQQFATIPHYFTYNSRMEAASFMLVCVAVVLTLRRKMQCYLLTIMPPIRRYCQPLMLFIFKSATLFGCITNDASILRTFSRLIAKQEKHHLNWQFLISSNYTSIKLVFKSSDYSVLCSRSKWGLSTLFTLISSHILNTTFFWSAVINMKYCFILTYQQSQAKKQYKSRRQNQEIFSVLPAHYEPFCVHTATIQLQH